MSQTHTSYSATYSRPPLEHAIKIARTMHLDHATEKLVRYYHEALVNRPPPDEASWFVNLYKVRDLLQKHYHSKQMKGRQAAQTALSISDKEWCKFGNVLNNNDLRHAETGKAPSVSPPRVKDVYDIARRWVAAYLKTKRLTTF